MKFAKNPRLEIEVAENGFILQVHAPDGEKTPGSTTTHVYEDLGHLLNAIQELVRVFHDIGQEKDESS